MTKCEMTNRRTASRTGYDVCVESALNAIVIESVISSRCSINRPYNSGRSEFMAKS